MSATPKQSRRMAAPSNVGPFQPLIDSYAISLRAENKSTKTFDVYVSAALKFAGRLLDPDLHAKKITKVVRSDWLEVTKADFEHYMVWFLEHYSTGYANNQYRALKSYLNGWPLRRTARIRWRAPHHPSRGSPWYR